MSLVGDYTHARNIDTGQPLPRISPLRVTFAVDYGYGLFGARGDGTRVGTASRAGR